MFSAKGRVCTYIDANVSAVMHFKAIQHPPSFILNHPSSEWKRDLIIKTSLEDMLVAPALWHNWETKKKVMEAVCKEKVEEERCESVK